MLGRHSSPIARRGSLALQVAVAVPLLVPPLVGRPPGTLFIYYGAVVALLPAAIRAVSGTGLSPFQRSALSLGIGLHGWGLLLRIYPRVPWWDFLTHVVSAAFLAAGVYAVVLAVTRSRPAALAPGLHVLALLAVVLAGVGWEVYEVIAPWQTTYPTGDALTDLVADALGWALMTRLHPAVLGDVPDHLTPRVQRLLSASRVP